MSTVSPSRPKRSDAEGVPLLRTKLYIPPLRPGQVPRPRLIERLNAGLGRKLTLVSAPAGFGKTTLLSEWIASHRRGRSRSDRRDRSTADQALAPPPVAWLSLDEGDNDFAHFVTHLVAALQTVQPGLGETALAVFQSPQLPPVEAVLTSLLNEIGQIQERLVLVLDDYHVIQSSTNQAVSFLLERLPPATAALGGLHLVIVTRRDPALPLARLRARGQMTEIRAGDLQFTEKEAARFLNQAMGLALSSEEIALLERRTEGWIAGLQLAALALQGRYAQRNRAEFIQAFSGDDRYVIDYLVSEVLSGQPQEVQRFLLHTALLDRLCGSLCDAVLPGSAESPGGEGQRLLECLERANLFLVPLDNRREWYRYHHLFGDVLRRRLRQAEPGQIPGLHRRASAWYEGEGYIDEAIRHALAAQDLVGAARLVEQNALQLLIHSELATLIRWLGALPDDLIRSRPWLCVYSAWAHFIVGQAQVAQLRLHDAQGLSHLAEPDLLGHVAIIRARIALADQDFSSAVQLARQALEHVPARHPVRGHVAVIEGQAAFMRGDLALASRALSEAVSIARECGHLFMVVDATTRLGHLQTLQGHPHQALETYQEALQQAHVDGRTLPVAGNTHLRMAMALRQQNKLGAAAHHLAQGLELCKLFGNPRSGCLALARLRQAQGDWDDALRALKDAERQAAGAGVAFDLWEVEHVRLWLSLARGSQAAGAARAERAPAAASRWVRESGLSAGDEPAFSREPEHILLARALIATGRPEQASRLLERLFQAAQAGERAGSSIEILALRALALQAQGKRPQALDCLKDALALAEPGGYVRVFVDEGQPMVALLRQAAPAGIAPAFVRRLLAVPGAPARAPALHETPAQPLLDPLSERELDVLRLLATSLSSTEIARELTIAVSTVRSHTKSIYAKLDVHRRLDAVERAKELHLI